MTKFSEGALIRLQQAVVNPREDAAIGLAGPIYGLGAAVAALAIWLGTGQAIFAVIAGVGAWINLFNLLPIGSLDGGRGFRSMSRTQRLIGAATAAAAWYCTDDGLLLIVALVCFWRGAADISAQENCWKVTATYCFLILALTAISTVRMWVDTAASVVAVSPLVGAQWR